MKKQKLSTNWDLSQLGKKINDPAFLSERKKAQKLVSEFTKKYKNKNAYLDNPKKVKQAIVDYETLTNLGVKEGYYYFLRESVESGNSELKGASFKAADFYTKLGNELEFFVLDLGAIPKKQQKTLLKSNELESEKYWLEGVFENAQYFLSEKEEQLLSLKSGVSHGNWTDMIEEFLSKEQADTWVKNSKGKIERRQVGFEQLMALCGENNKKIRNEAKKQVDSILAKHSDVAEKEINAILENKKINDELRGYSRPDQSRHISDDIDSDVVDALVRVVEKNYKVSHDFYRLKAQMVGEKRIPYQNRSIQTGKFDKEYTYEQAYQIVQNSFDNLDSDFASIFKSFSYDGYTDVMPKKGKRGGAFCAGANAAVPGSYIMLNFTQKARDIKTIAHEAGHGINNQLIKRKQRDLYCGTPLSTAEVASTFCEDFAYQEIKKALVTDQEKLDSLMDSMEDSFATVFRQIGCYQFEFALHNEFRQKGYLSKKDISHIFVTHMKAYMGRSVSFDDEADYWWVYWSHIRNFFYVYSYSSGLLIAKAMQNLIKQDSRNMDMIKDVFFSAGLSDSPKNIFKQMKIDITKDDFWQMGIDMIKDDLKEAKRLAKKLGKI